MKPSVTHSVEPLEARIAPARLIVVGAPNEGPAGPYDVDYKDENAVNDAIFLDTEIEAAKGDAGISGRLGPGLVGAADTHYVRMSAGDLMVTRISTSTSNDLIRVTS